jgi:hypothetical protein
MAGMHIQHRPGKWQVLKLSENTPIRKRSVVQVHVATLWPFEIFLALFAVALLAGWVSTRTAPACLCYVT